MPDFLLVAEEGLHLGFYERYCGRPAVLLLAHDAESCDGVVAGLDTKSVLCLIATATIDDGRRSFLCIPDAGELVAALGETPPAPGSSPVALVLDATLRLAFRLENPALVDAVTERIVERLLPDIVSTFHYEVTHLEGFKVARYDAGQRGFFRAHRDNCTPDAQHRRFAMTLNLNDDYEGGALSFPEFGPQRYRPPAGGALVFSGNMLHEAGEVTAGQRFVLLTFMWGAR